MSPFKSIKGRALGKMLEGFKSSDIGKGFGSGGGGGGGSDEDGTALKPFTSIDYIFDFSSSSDTSLKYVSSPGTLYSVDVQNQSDHYINFKLGFDLTSHEGLNISSSYERNQGNEATKSDTISISGSFKSKSDTEYAFIIEEESFLTTKLNMKRNIKGIDYNFNVNQSLNDSRSYNSANIALSKTF